MNLIRFIKFHKTILRLPFGYTVITNQGIGKDKNLSFIGRIGKAFRIACHGSIKDHLSCNTLLMAERYSFEDGAIFKDQICRYGVGFQCFGFRVSGFGFRILDFAFRVLGFEFRVLGKRD